MRMKRLCAPMMTLCLLLAACGGGSGGRGDEELALDIRAEYLGMATCAATAEITADYGQRVYVFTLELQYTKGGETVLTVTAPEDIAGVTARLKDGAATLEYDGASLETGELDGQGLSPVSALPALLNAVQTGFIAEVGREDLDETATLRICCRDPEQAPGAGEETAVWFDLETHGLVQGEISVDGARVILCRFTQFTMEPATQQEG